ncbi:TetR/AcrR family transcriptional regulator C-terminal domain-containing protein [Devosia sp.]|uniref:TetR/AcrR family transcriptional regulator C-terminal domain-containing protein n=1 Tax=Devosia sp. TaxID=1871048 RepID=UPI003A94C2FD
MPTPKQIARRERIEAAAYAVLKESGYKSASLLAIARRASASNETLYTWYGSKQALFRSLVEANVAEARDLLQDTLEAGGDPIATLRTLGPVLLAMVTGDKAITLNRAAAGDVSDTHTLGPAIANFGRGTMAPLLRDLLAAAHRDGALSCDDPAEAADIYFRLLIGDLQVRRVIGVLDELTPEQIAERAAGATTAFLRLYAVPTAADRTEQP